MITPSVPPFPPQPISWSGIARICRRICLLRECGRADDAEELCRGALAEAIAAIRTSADTDSALEQRLEAIFLEETERVANAATLAELLAPLLNQPAPSHARPTAAHEFGSERPPQRATDAELRESSRSPLPPRPAPGDIAGFIDEMIAHERTAPVRRAS